MKKDVLFFSIAIFVWETAIAFIYGFDIRYNTTDFATMATTTFQYTFADISTSFNYLFLNSTQPPFPYIVIVFAIVLLVVGK